MRPPRRPRTVSPARTARDTLRQALGAAALEPDGVPGAVVALQTFGSFGASFHPHLHVLVTDGVFTRDGRFHPVIWPEENALEERFRRRFLLLLERAERLKPETRERFLRASLGPLGQDDTATRRN